MEEELQRERMARRRRRDAKERHTQAYLLLKKEIGRMGGLPRPPRAVEVRHEAAPGEPKRRSGSAEQKKSPTPAEIYALNMNKECVSDGLD